MVAFLGLFVSCASPPKRLSQASAAPLLGETFPASDGDSLPFRRWLPAGRSTDIVVVAVHGLGGAASDWRPLGEYLAPRGVAVYAHELRGMGNDPKRQRRGHIGHRGKWIDDLAAFTQQVRASHPEKPLFLYGESLGGLIGIGFLAKNPFPLNERPCGMILASPIVGVDAKVPRWHRLLLSVGARLIPRWRWRLLDLAPEGSDPQVVSTTTHEDQMAQTPHAMSHFSLRMLHEIQRLVSENREFLTHNTYPILVLHGGKDVFSTPEEIQQFYGRIGGNHKSGYLFPEGYHLLLHDHGATTVMQVIQKWLVENQKSCHMNDFSDG